MSTDCLQYLRAEMAGVLHAIKLARGTDLAARVLDLARLGDALSWADDRIEDFGWGLLFGLVIRAIALLRFLRRLQERSLYQVPEQPIEMSAA